MNRLALRAWLVIAVSAEIAVTACGSDSGPGDVGSTGGTRGGAGGGGRSGSAGGGRGGSAGGSTGGATGGSGGVVAGSGGSAGTGSAGTGAQAGTGGTCWRLPTVTRVRLLARAGQGAKLVGGRIEGSNESPTNGFVELGAITAAPADGSWAEVTVAGPKPYRYVKYYSPKGSYGAVAEVELYDGTTKLAGAGFGTAGARMGASTFEKALDGKPETFFEGPLADDNYVGLDLASGHLVSAPKASPGGGRPAQATMVTLTTDTAGATIKYTTDGSDPRAGKSYTGPIAIGDGTTQLRAIATKDCLFESSVTAELYLVGAAANAATTLHIGNSLTDTIDGFFAPVAQTGGITVDFHRYTIPGAGIEFLWGRPTGGFGEADVKASLADRSFDHITFQPFPNGPCSPDAEARDSYNFYKLQEARNPTAQVWIYQQWPTPDYDDCFSKGASWAQPPWNAPKRPTSWEDAVMNQLAYHESARTKLEAKMPGRPKPLLVPAGLALLNLKREIEAGKIPGMSNFFLSIFTKDGTDFHLSNPGRTFVAMLFHTCLFKRDPRGVLSHPQSQLTPEQNTAFQNVVWATSQAYQLCWQ